MAKEEYEIVWKEGGLFEKGKYIFQKKPDNSGLAIMYLIGVLFVVVLLLITLPVWCVLIGLILIVREKRYLAAIFAILGLIYFHVDINKGWLTSFFNNGSEEFKNLYYANHIAVGLGISFIIDAVLISIYGKKSNDRKSITLPQIVIYLFFPVLLFSIVYFTGIRELKAKIEVAVPEVIVDLPVDLEEEIPLIETKENIDYNKSYLFENYQAELSFNGNKAIVNFEDESYKYYSTHIEKVYNESDINFAGYYVVVLKGCGTDCTTGIIIDVRDGNIYDLPLGEGKTAWCSNYDNYFNESINYKADSRLFVTISCFQQNNSQSEMIYYVNIWDEEKKSFEPEIIRKAYYDESNEDVENYNN